MLERARNRLKFLIERLLLRGAHYRLLFIAAVIGLVSVIGGYLVLLTDTGFSGLGEAAWWAFLRLTDPGYLGDDEGLLRRIISTAVTILGYVLFMGSLIAIMTQWLTQKLRNLERGLTPIAANGHILILGWTNRTPAIVHELMIAEGRVKRFLQRRGLRRLVIVILAEDVDAAMVQELRDELGPLWDARRIIFRSGSPLEIDHLRRVDYAHAAAIVVPSADFAAGGAQAMDNRTVKTLLSIGRHQADRETSRPLVVSELFDDRKVQLARKAYGGPIELLASDAVICRLIAQTVRHPGLSHVFNEFMVHGAGSEIYVRHFPQLAGQRFYDLFSAFPRAIPLGLVRPSGSSFSPLLNPPDDTVCEEHDRLVLLAESYEAAELLASSGASGLRHGTRAPTPAPTVKRRILILGWSHQVAVLLREFTLYHSERFEVDLLTSMETGERQRHLGHYDLPADKMQLNHIEGDYTLPAVMAGVDPTAYDNIVFLGSDRVDSDEEADARTLTGALLLQERLGADADSPAPHVLIELMEPNNADLLPPDQAEVMLGPKLVSHMLAQVALRRELRAVYDELFGPGGAEIFIRPLEYYSVNPGSTDFSPIQQQIVSYGDIALGVWRHGIVGADGFFLNPPPGEVFDLGDRDELIVLSTYVS